MPLNELAALTILNATPGLGPTRNKQLLSFFGSGVKTLEAGIGEVPSFIKIPESTKKEWKWWIKNTTWEINLEKAEKEGVQLIPYTSPKFPQKLLQIPDHPLLLYVKGALKSQDAQNIAVVGTRASSLYGLEMGEKISQDLARCGFTVVSGLARGVDTAAHRGALAYGRTLAVIGSGFHHIYPKENEKLAHEIAEKGALISEYALNIPPNKGNFPQRNRIVSGMTLGSLLIEAPLKSGAMITMEQAYQYGRKIYAIPGRVDSENFKGNHYLIKSGHALLVENASDIVQSFGNLFNCNELVPKNPPKTFPLNKEENELWQMLPAEEINIEELIKKTKLPIIKLNILLMSLIMKKAVKEYPGKIYKKV